MTYTIKQTPETAKFWEGSEQGKLFIQHCSDCSAHYFPPAPICPKCSSKRVEWVQASGQASLYSFVIAQTPWPFWPSTKPMSVALIDLAEGVRLISTVVECEQTPESLQLDMPLQATWTRCGAQGPNLLCFKKTQAGETT
jgi:uncharacterized protein